MSDEKVKGVKGRAIVFHTPNEAEFKKIKIKDGTVVIENKEFDVSRLKSINLKSGTGTRPLYMFSWKSLIPAGFTEKNDEISYAPTSNEENNIKNYLKFWKALKKSGHKGKVIESNSWKYKRIVPMHPKFLKTKYLPELMKNTADMRFLKNMKSYAQGKGGGGGNMMYILLAFGGGLLWAIVLMVLMGYIKL